VEGPLDDLLKSSSGGKLAFLEDEDDEDFAFAAALSSDSFFFG